MRAAIIELPFISRAIGVARRAVPGDLHLGPFAGIFKSIGKSVSALPVLDAIDKSALDKVIRNDKIAFPSARADSPAGVRKPA